MIKYLGAAAALAAAYGITGALEVTMIALIVLASLFYVMAFNLFIGTSRSVIAGKTDVLHMITVYMIYVTMTTVVFMSDYSWVAFMALPWLLIQTGINIVSLLVKFEIITFINKQ